MDATPSMTLADLRRLLQPWDRYGFEERHDALIWGALTATTNRGWLHQVMLPHSPVDLERFVEANRFLGAFRFPRLWHELNGFNLFARAFSVFGPSLLSNPSRVWEAYLILSVNVGLEDLHDTFDGIVFGCSSLDGHDAWFLESRSGEIIALDRATSSETFRWPDLDTFLWATLHELADSWSDEARRVSALSFLQRPV